jgi:hypothetical protein
VRRDVLFGFPGFRAGLQFAAHVAHIAAKLGDLRVEAPHHFVQRIDSIFQVSDLLFLANHSIFHVVSFVGGPLCRRRRAQVNDFPLAIVR